MHTRTFKFHLRTQGYPGRVLKHVQVLARLGDGILPEDFAEQVLATGVATGLFRGSVSALLAPFLVLRQQAHLCHYTHQQFVNVVVEDDGGLHVLAVIGRRHALRL